MSYTLQLLENKQFSFVCTDEDYANSIKISYDTPLAGQVLNVKGKLGLVTFNKKGDVFIENPDFTKLKIYDIRSSGGRRRKSKRRKSRMRRTRKHRR